MTNQDSHGMFRRKLLKTIGVGLVAVGVGSQAVSAAQGGKSDGSEILRPYWSRRGYRGYYGGYRGYGYRGRFGYYGVNPCGVDPCADPCADIDPCADPCADIDPCADPCANVDPCADPCADVDPCAVDPCADPCAGGLYRRGFYGRGLYGGRFRYRRRFARPALY
ncbi:hypothetical protein [Haloarchaeobius sp. HME9146]|uniref:hypothetical protein n=1 Tax=Haloarchaeobius sp. HME9146 TaxID=2978732 RepID=UPI0021BEC816|nr:hypothetical protein [Haloarchaeobius sp. HME9146]MCT9098357.1 hypothetical protein [Haloarchaeobius sp. HME9146]